MSEPEVTAPLIVGMGNPMRSDDGVGPWIAQRLAAAGHRACSHSADGTGLIELMAGAPRAIVIDAMRSGVTPGTVLRIAARTVPVPTGSFHYSSHAFGLAEAIETARALGGLPPDLTVIGIEGRDFGFGEALSQPVAAAADRLAAELAHHPLDVEAM